MTESTGCAILKERFIAAGFAIEENYPLAEGVVTFSVDGFDPKQRIGYEFITTEAGDRQELTPLLLAELEARMARGELYILLIDELDIDGPEPLKRAADEFLALCLQRRADARAKGQP